MICVGGVDCTRKIGKARMSCVEIGLFRVFVFLRLNQDALNLYGGVAT